MDFYIDTYYLRMAYNEALRNYKAAKAALDSEEAKGSELNRRSDACEKAEAVFRVVERVLNQNLLGL